jgi:hypothetical protein
MLGPFLIEALERSAGEGRAQAAAVPLLSSGESACTYSARRVAGALGSSIGTHRRGEDLIRI